VSATALGAIIAVAAGYATSIFAIIWYLGGRIDRSEDRMTTRMDKLEDRFERMENRFDRVEAAIHEMHEDVTVLKATQHS
jgi:hypothetical protein